MSSQVLVNNMMEDVAGRNGVSALKTSPASVALSPIPCLDGVAVSPMEDADSSNDANGEKIDFKDDLKDEFEDVKDELETEQVDDDLEGDRIAMKSPLKKDAFELVDEFSDTIEDPCKGSKVNGDDPNSSELKISEVKGSNNENSNEGAELATVEENVDEVAPGISEEISENADINGDLNPLEFGDDTSEIVDGEDSELLGQGDPFENCDDSNDDSAAQEIGDEISGDLDVDPLMAESDASEQDSINELESNPGKRKNLEDAEDNSSVRKSSRLRTKIGTPTDDDKPREKQKMLQKPGERPNQVEEESFDMSDSETAEAAEDTAEVAKRSGEQVGDPTREPGADAVRRIDQDLLLPFRYGWSRECVFRAVKNGPTQVDVYYWPPKDGDDLGPRSREFRRKRRSKVDQERYFEEFTHKILSVNNFTYVRRALGLNNEAYEMVRYAKPGLETRSDKNRRATKKVANYKEVAEHEGLVSSSQSEGEESESGIEEITEFDIGLPLTLQVHSRVTPLREEHKKRRQWPDRERCVTPPLAKDMPWTLLDDDPLGVYTELFTELESIKSPPTPPPLRALRLTSHKTIDSIAEKYKKIRDGLPNPLDRITTGNKDLVGSDNLASHDLAVRKFKNYRPPQSHIQTNSRPQMRGGFSGGRRAPPPSQRQPQSPVRPPGSPVQGFVKVRLPMPSTNGKRPVVELVMLTNGKYQPIKFTNNRQVTESIPKRLFDQANLMRKTLYQRSVQVPKIGTKQVFLAINPTPGGVRPYSSPQQPPRPVQQTSDQVSILVRPAGGGNAVLLNVPRSVALKVKVGTTLSFSASNDQKYTVIDNKMHPPVGRQKPATPTRQLPPPCLPNLPSGVSIRPVSAAAQAKPGPVAAGRPMAAAGSRKPQHRPSAQVRPRQPIPPQPRQDMFSFTPCSPFCPGVTGIPELECTQCHSLFHPKCVNIPSWQVANIQHSFKCKRCSGSSSRTEVIDLD